MVARVELRKCTICHKTFGWDGMTRCICNDCKAENVSGDSHKSNNKPLFILVNHRHYGRVSA